MASNITSVVLSSLLCCHSIVGLPYGSYLILLVWEHDFLVRLRFPPNANLSIDLLLVLSFSVLMLGHYSFFLYIFSTLKSFLKPIDLQLRSVRQGFCSHSFG